MFPEGIHSPPPKIRGRGVLVFEIWTKRGVMKKLLRSRGLVEREEYSYKEGDFQIFSSVFLQKSMFSLLLDSFRVINIHTYIINTIIL